MSDMKPTKRGGLLARSALGLFVAFGTVAGVSVATAPAVYAKAPKLNLSKGFQSAAIEAQKAIEAAQKSGNTTDAKAKLDAAFAAIETEDDRYMAGSFAISLGGTASDGKLQRRGIEAMLQSGKLSIEEQGRFNYFMGQFQYQDKNYAAALQSLLNARRAGFRDESGQMDLLLYDSAARSGNKEAALALANEDIAAARASGTAPPAIALRSALVAAYDAKQLSTAYEYAPQLVGAYPTTENWNLVTVIVRELASLPAQDNIDLMRLMQRTGGLKDGRDYLEYIQNATGRVGVLYPGEVINVAREGLSKGFLKQQDVAEYLTLAQAAEASDKASLAGQERDARGLSAKAASVLATADAFLSYEMPAKAEELYKISLTKPGVDKDRALTRIGIAQIDQGKYSDAVASFGKVTGPREPIAKLWAIYAKHKMAPAPVVPAAAPAASE